MCKILPHGPSLKAIPRKAITQKAITQKAITRNAILKCSLRTLTDPEQDGTMMNSHMESQEDRNHD
ncbi:MULTISPECIES: hypothetical protein [Clostridia]|uniref:hypothetical protein n=1 Tax=Clostridia TaxID=186801 RepID=UPI001A9AE74D|nr:MULTISPECIES: hypothetical protein [Clostridia]MCH1935586.1 hypothetical protein [Enterocloster sp. OA11]